MYHAIYSNFRNIQKHPVCNLRSTNLRCWRQCSTTLRILFIEHRSANSMILLLLSKNKKSNPGNIRRKICDKHSFMMGITFYWRHWQIIFVLKFIADVRIININEHAIPSNTKLKLMFYVGYPYVFCHSPFLCINVC